MAVITKLRTTAEIQPILQRILSGEPLRPISADSGVSRSTLFQWKKAVEQAKVAGEDPMKAVVSSIR